MFLQQLVNGLSIGLVFALLAVGLSLAFATSRVVNFAHGDVFVLGAVLASTLVQQMSLPFALSGAVAVTVVGAGAGAFSWFVLWRLRTTLERSVATILVGIAVRDGILLAVGSDSVGLPDVYPHGTVDLGAAATVPYSAFVVIIAAVGMLAASHYFLTRTHLGVQMQASAENPTLAASIGIPSRRVQATAFGLSCAMAAAAGVILIPTWQMNFASGLPVGLKAFTAALLGGFGQVGGSLVGGLTVGLGEAFVAGYADSTWKDAFVYTGLLLILAFMPRRFLERGTSRVA